jgi:hypothetical protein
LQEYAVAGGHRVQVEFVDPHDDPKLEAEANSRYDIRPVPFEVAGKYRASVVNTYFDILVSYGDQTQVLNFRDLIDVKARDENEVTVELKDPEYAITGAIRKVLLNYQGGGSVFDALAHPLTFTGYISALERPAPAAAERAYRARCSAGGPEQTGAWQIAGGLSGPGRQQDLERSVGTRLRLPADGPERQRHASLLVLHDPERRPADRADPVAIQ